MISYDKIEEIFDTLSKVKPDNTNRDYGKYNTKVILFQKSDMVNAFNPYNFLN